jgi:hypothetical protein
MLAASNIGGCKRCQPHTATTSSKGNPLEKKTGGGARARPATGREDPTYFMTTIFLVAVSSSVTNW